MGEAIADTKQEKQVVHYSSKQKILLVGEGNFSFASCLAKGFGSAKNMVATSLDSRESVLAKYSNAAPRNLTELEDMGCVILHEVDVHTMRRHPLLLDQLLHQDLVRTFFNSACEMLKGSGEVHVTHKTSHPFSKWERVKLAEEVGLYLVEEASFSRGDYPGYLNKRGSGKKCNRTFPIGLCSTYKFAKLPLLEFSQTTL
ncbi:PREDICTED: uncharacterized protein At4g26485-like [Fragaria vesca subsp. vesca]